MSDYTIVNLLEIDDSVGGSGPTRSDAVARRAAHAIDRHRAPHAYPDGWSSTAVT